MVVDTSILMAVFFNEEFGPWAADRLSENQPHLRMSTVDYAEALILIGGRHPRLFPEIREAVETSSVRLVPPTPEQAETAARARLRRA